jgi:hypothetical protein
VRGLPNERLPKRPELIAGLLRRLARLCRDLDLTLHQLRLQEAVVARVTQQRLDRLRQGERLVVEEHQLLLDADRVLPAVGELLGRDPARAWRNLGDTGRRALLEAGRPGRAAGEASMAPRLPGGAAWLAPPGEHSQEEGSGTARATGCA